MLPPGYDAAQAYPAILVFTGGPQSLQMAERTLSVDWQQEAERRRYILVSPGTPDGTLFFEAADRVFPAFLDQILRDYRIRGGKLHVAGHSNGGLSAFHVAALYPRYFATLTGYPGLLDGGDLARAAAIKPLCIFMHVGDKDDGWRRAMQEQSDNLARQDIGFASPGKESDPSAERPGDQSVSAAVRSDRRLLDSWPPQLPPPSSLHSPSASPPPPLDPEPMPLTAGARLGPYEIISALGAGGMGEVYRATDTRLGGPWPSRYSPLARRGSRTPSSTRARSADCRRPEPSTHLRAVRHRRREAAA